MPQHDPASILRLASEELTLSKQLVEGETVRVRVETEHADQPFELTTARETISVETVEIGRQVAEMPQIRTEGNVTIIPVVEEEAVIVKRLILKQEVRLTRSRTEETVVETVPLRSQHAIIERFSPSAPNPSETNHD